MILYVVVQMNQIALRIAHYLLQKKISLGPAFSFCGGVLHPARPLVECRVVKEENVVSSFYFLCYPRCVVRIGLHPSDWSCPLHTDNDPGCPTHIELFTMVCAVFNRGL